MPLKLRLSCCDVQEKVKKCNWPSLKWVMVVGGFLVNFTLGICIATGNIAPYAISYTRQRSLDPYREVATLSYAPWLLATGQATQAMAMFLGGVMVNRIGVRSTVFIGCLASSGGMLLSAGAVVLSFWAVVITYGVLGGLGTGIAQSATLAAAVRWDPQHKGLAMATILSGFAMTPIIFTPIQTAFVNPENLIPNDYPDGFAYFDQSAVLDLVPFLFVFIGGIMFVIQMIGATMVVERRNIPKMVGPKSCKTVLKYLWASFKPKTPSCCLRSRKDGGADDEIILYNGGQMSNDLKQQGSNGSEIMRENMTENGASEMMKETNVENGGKELMVGNEHKAECKTSPPEDVTPRNLLKRWDFYILWFSFMILAGSHTYITSIYKAFGEEFIFDDEFLAIIGSLGGVAIFISKIPVGIAADRFDCKATLVVTVSVAVVFLFNTYGCSVLSIGGPAAFAVCFFLISGGLGGMRSVLPACIAQWYGNRNFAVNYGILYTSNVPASFLAMAFSPVLHPYIGWEGELLLVASLSFIGLVMIIIGGDRRKKKNN